MPSNFKSQGGSEETLWEYVVKRIFFSRQNNSFVGDSMCTCGHLESEHGSKTTKLNCGRLYREAGHGNCCKGKCQCPKFTWSRYVTIDELADQIISKRKSVLEVV